MERNSREEPLDYANRDVGIAAASSTREVENGKVVVYLLDVRSKRTELADPAFLKSGRIQSQ